VHFSHWTNAKGNVQPGNVSQRQSQWRFTVVRKLVCKRNQEAIDLFIPVLLNSERKWWKGNGLPIYHDSKKWYFAPAEWNEAQISRVLLNFSAILVQVKNRKRISVAHVHKCHDKIEKRADIIFQTRNKRCVSLFLQLGNHNLEHSVKEVNDKGGTLRISLFGVERYGSNRDQLKQLVRFTMTEDPGLYDDERVRPFFEMETSHYYAPGFIEVDEDVPM
jgi:hypothetical protein